MHRQTLVRAMRAAGLAAISASLVAPPAMAAKSTSLLKQVTTATRDGVGSEPSATTIGGHTFFNAYGHGEGTDLWEITPTGAAKLAEIPGSAREWTQVGSHIFFSTGGQLWTTDGTSDGTSRVTEAGTNVRNLLAVGEELVFSGGPYSNAKKLDPATGTVSAVVLAGDSPELYVEDFFALGDTLLSSTFDFNASSNQRRLVTGVGEDSEILTDGTDQLIIATDSPGMVRAGGRLFFVVSNGGARTIYSTDGTQAGTAPVRDGEGDPITATSNYVQFVPTSGGKVAFLSDGKVYETDGTTTAVRGSGPDEWSDPTFTNGKIIFGASAQSESHLWSLTLGDASSAPLSLRIAGVSSISLSDGIAYVRAYEDGRPEFLRTDGTIDGTSVVGNPSAFTDLGEATARVGGGIFFAGSSRAYGRELFAVGGNVGATPQLVTDINTDPTGANIQDDGRHAVTFGGKTLFATGSSDSDALQPWISDGTTAGTFQIDPDRQFGELRNAVSAGNRAVFETEDGKGEGEGAQLWTTDGTASGTAKLSPDAPAAGSDASDPVVIGTTVFYIARHSAADSGTGIFSSDGASPGTELARPAGWPTDVYVNGLKALGTKLIYAIRGRDDYQTTQLWSFDTVSGTATKLADEYADYEVSRSGVSGGKLYLAVSQNTPDYENQVWETDGTVAGTRNLDVEPGERPNHGAGTTIFADTTAAYAMTAVPGTDNYAVHLTRLTGATIQRITESPSIPTSQFYGAAMLGGALYSRAGDTLVKVAPTATEPTVVKDFGRELGPLTTVGDKLYLAASDGEHGYEPWESDGTAAGTAPIGDVLPGIGSSDPYAFFGAGDRVAFLAWTEELGTQLYAYGDEPVVVTPIDKPADTTPPVGTTPGAGNDTKTDPPKSSDPAPAPKPTSPVDGRAEAEKVKRKVSEVVETKKAYAFDVSGNLVGAKGLQTKEACRGQVEILVTATTKKGKKAKLTVKTLSKKRTRLDWSKGKCTFDKTITIAKKDVPAGAKVEATVTFLGSTAQKPKTGKPIEIELS